MIELNLFKIKLFPPKILYKFPAPIEDYYSFAYQNDGIFTDNIIISYKKPENIKYEEILSFSLNQKLKNRLVQLFLFKEKSILYKLNSFFSPINYNLNLQIRKYFDGGVEFINNTYYFSLEIYHSLESKKNLLEALKEEKDLIGKKVIDYKKQNISTIVDVIYPNNSKWEIEKERIKFYLNIEKNEPIILTKFKNNEKIYPYYASMLKLSFSIKDIDIDLKITNEKRKNLIINAIKNKAIDLLDYKPLKIKSLTFKKPSLFIKNENKIISKPAYSLQKEHNQDKPFNIFNFFPVKVPTIIKEKIPIIILIEKDIRIDGIKTYINSLIYSLKKFFSFKKKDLFFIDLNPFNILKILNNYKTDSIPPLVILISENNNYYEEIKRKLFKHNFISQNIVASHLDQNKEFELKNLIFQILVKYGIYPYSIPLTTKYDYILGIDVGNNRFNKRSIAGGISVINKNGIFEKLIPIKTLTNGENIDLSFYLEELSLMLDLENKNILILRDGKLQISEIKTILKESKNLSTTFTFLNIIKNHKIRIFDAEGNKGIILKEDLALLLAHKSDYAKSIKIDTKVKVHNENYFFESITKEDLEILYYLTFLNYSNMFKENLRLPAPIHYSDKFVKALGKEWEIKENYLQEGFLYFI